MNLQQLIDKRLSLDFSQEKELINIISQGQRKDKRALIKTALQTKFYTIFDRHKLATKFFIYGGQIEHNCSKEELQDFRKHLLDNF